MASAFRRLGWCRAVVAAAGLGGSSITGCTTVDPGPDFNVADIVYDDNFFYCEVEPVLFASRCGPGENGTDPPGGCHFNATSYRLTDYPQGTALVGDSCSGGGRPTVAIPAAAHQNYQTSQIKMDQDPDLAQLMNRPTGRALHPRAIFSRQSPQADVIALWATQYSTQ